jgi:hypothetical protein
MQTARRLNPSRARASRSRILRTSQMCGENRSSTTGAVLEWDVAKMAWGPV